MTKLSPLLAIVIGILTLAYPAFLNIFVAVHLIVHGLIGLGALRNRSENGAIASPGYS